GERRGEKRGADHVREPRRTRVFECALTDVRLHELEVGEAWQAVASAERQTDDQLEREHTEEPRPAGHHGDERERPDDDLVEARRAGIEDVEVSVGVRAPLGSSLHFGKYYTVGRCAQAVNASSRSFNRWP